MRYGLGPDKMPDNTHSSEEVSVMEMEQRGEQSISLSMSRIAEWIGYN